MIAAVRLWFAALSRREQWLVGLAAALAALVLLIFGILLPGMSVMEKAKIAHEEAVQRRGRIEATVAAALSQKPRSAVAASADIDLVVVQGAAEKGFDLIKSTNATPGQISFRIDQARAPALVAWLAELESQGVEVRTMTLRSNSGGSVVVDAQMQKVAR